MRALAITAAFVAGLTPLLTPISHAQAPAPRHALRWTRGPGAERCIDAADLRASVESRLHRRVFVARDVAPIVIDAHIARAASGWHVAIAVRDEAGASIGARELDDPSPDCRSVDETLVLVIALIVDPEATSRDVSPAPTPPPAGARWRAGVSAHGTAAVGLLPGGAFGGALAVTVAPPWMPPAVIRASLWREDEARRAQVGARFQLATAGVTICPRVSRRGALVVAACAGAETGHVAARGFGFDRSQRSATIVGHAVIEPHVEIQLSRKLAVEARVGLWVPIIRPRFTFDQGGVPVRLYQPPAISLVGHIGMSLHF